MARSGSYNFSLTRDNIIKRAFQIINVFDLGSTIPTNETDFAADILNMMIKHWEAEGINIWKRRQAILFTINDDSDYSLGSTGTHCTNSYANTTLASDAASGASTLTVSSITGFSASDNIGIELDDGTRQWTTISGAPSGTTITLATTLTSAAASGNTVVAYTDKINRPLRILRATTFDLNTNNEVSLSKVGYDQYFNISQKTSEGSPNQFYYDKTLDNGTLYVYPRPNNVDQIIKFTYHDAIQDFDSSSNDPDFPSEWLYALTFNLAAELAYSYGKFIELDKIVLKAHELKESVKWFDSDEESLQINFDPGA